LYLEEAERRKRHGAFEITLASAKGRENRKCYKSTQSKEIFIPDFISEQKLFLINPNKKASILPYEASLKDYIPTVCAI
jgi:hypothetical protein